MDEDTVGLKPLDLDRENFYNCLLEDIKFAKEHPEYEIRILKDSVAQIVNLLGNNVS